MRHSGISLGLESREIAHMPSQSSDLTSKNLSMYLQREAAHGGEQARGKRWSTMGKS